MKKQLYALLSLFGMSALVAAKPGHPAEAVVVPSRRITPRYEASALVASPEARVGHAPGRFGNQRQYRKKLASNPSLRNSKKARSKN